MNHITQYGLGVLVLVLVLGSVFKLDLPYICHLREIQCGWVLECQVDQKLH